MPQKKHFQSLCRMAKQADPADFLSIVYAKNDDRDRHLRGVAPTKRAFGYSHQKNAQQPGTRCKCGNSSINLIMPITYVPLAGMAKLADAADLNPNKSVCIGMHWDASTRTKPMFMLVPRICQLHSLAPDCTK